LWSVLSFFFCLEIEGSSKGGGKQIKNQGIHTLTLTLSSPFPSFESVSWILASYYILSSYIMSGAGLL